MVRTVLGWTASTVLRRLASLPSDWGAVSLIETLPQRVCIAFEREDESLDAAIVRLFPGDCLPRGISDPAEAVLTAFRERSWTAACAESCTGGLLGGALTSISGSSDVFLGSAVCYADSAKERLLGVPREILSRRGAVSSETALAMAEGSRRLYGASVALAVTGIAGPEGGSSDKPVGTVWFGLSSPGGSRAFLRLFAGLDRERVRSFTVAVALEALWRVAKGG